MLVGRERFDEVYATIRQSACGAGQTVLILVAPDTDAICACQILCRLLRDDNVPFCTKPVSGYADVRAATEDVSQQFSDIKTIIMLNCGATVNLRSSLTSLRRRSSWSTATDRSTCGTTTRRAESWS